MGTSNDSLQKTHPPRVLLVTELAAFSTLALVLAVLLIPDRIELWVAVAGASTGTLAVFAIVSARALRADGRGQGRQTHEAVAVIQRLRAVLDAVDEAIVLQDEQGVVRILNKRANELLDVEPGRWLGSSYVDLLRTLARKMEAPEEYMEIFQPLWHDPQLELRADLEQILPERRRLRLYSSATRGDSGEVAGRIDVYADVSESVRTAEQNESLLDKARQTAESYQRALLPERAPLLPRVGVVAHYVPSSEEHGVRGDFYDFLSLEDGGFGFVLGDVCGAGPRAAGDAALARYSLRAFATEQQDPAALLQRLNRFIFPNLGSERFVRVVLCLLDPHRGLLEYVNAGHVPPVLYRARHREVEWLGEGGLPLGVEEDAPYKTARIELEPGDMLALYSDGVTEAQRHGRPFGQGKLGDLMQEYGVGTAGELVQAIRRSVEAWVSGGGLRDDVALVACNLLPESPAAEPTRELVVPNEPAHVREVRAFVADFLAQVRAPVRISHEVVAAVGEAASNASRHGRRRRGQNELRVACALEGPDVIVTLADEGPGFVPDGKVGEALPDKFSSGGRGLFLMRQLMDDVEISSPPSGTTVTMRRRLSEPAPAGVAPAARGAAAGLPAST